MPSALPEEAFEREYGCSLAEWRRWMPEAVHGHAYRWLEPGGLEVVLGAGHLRLTWQELSPRVIASVRLPRLQVRFQFADVAAQERQRFLRRFDLHLQRGGG